MLESLSSSLKIRYPINTEKARNIVKKRIDLVGKRIRVVNNKIKQLEGKRESQKKKKKHLETLNIDPDVNSHIENYLKTKRKSVENETKERHKVKLIRLKTKHES